MPLITSYPGGFPNGVAIRNVPLAMAYPGKVYWVSSTQGSNGQKGTFDRPWGTINYAAGRCSVGDIIYVKPGHIETVTAAAGLALATAGIAIIGHGAGASRPKINFTTATTADMDVDAASITMMNFLFTGGIDALAAPLDVNASDFALVNCEYRDVTGETVVGLLGDANADR